MKNIHYKDDVSEKINEAKFGRNKATKKQIENLTPELDRLKEITEKIKKSLKENSKIEKINNLYELVYSENLLVISHNKISKNEGAGTPGSMGESVENSSYLQIKEISKKIQEKKFHWKKIKKVEIPRKNKKPRPLGIPNYSEKLVQNNILMILEAIYEPIFEHTNKNFGFRPHKSCKDCIREITKPQNQGLFMVIEGDIQGAYDNVHPPTLAKILSEIIDDKDLINLIYESCITPTITKNKIIEPSEMGTPQGSIISPILFNIYMQKFDEFVEETLKGIQEEENKNRKTTRPWKRNPKYEKITHKIKRIRKQINEIKIHNKIKTHESIKNIKQLKIPLNKLIKKRSKTYINDYNRAPIRYLYNRYADDFLILTNQLRKFCKTIKEKCSKFLNTELRLDLSDPKTFISNIDKTQINYLGFSLFMTKKGPRKSKTKTRRKLIHSNMEILVGIDENRMYERIKERKYSDQKLFPREKPALSMLETNEIIQHYNDVMRGTVNYYYDLITYKSTLNRIIYIMYYSCLKTIAQKYKSSITKIFQKYGWKEFNTKMEQTNRTRLIYEYKIQKSINDTENKFAILQNYKDLVDIAENNMIARKNNPKYILEEERNLEDIWKKRKYNWRTKFKLIQFCAICGSNDNLQTHHIDKIKGPTINKKDIFVKNIMSNLNRKQLTVCKKCHVNIHNGKLNNISLTDLYDIRISRIENYLRAETTNYYQQTTNYEKSKQKSKDYVLIPQARYIINNKTKSQYISIKYHKHKNP